MKTARTFKIADLFAGAGGALTGATRAATRLGASVDAVAVNHWDVAVNTLAANHQDATLFLSDVEAVDPRVAVPGGHLDLLLAGPSCVHFSQARGGQPTSDQQRASAWDVVKWARALDIDTILVENVPEFQTWGPIDPDLSRPCKVRKGMYFHQWLRMLQNLGYTVEHRILCSADYGDATTRKRLFIQASKSGRIVWPRPTHAKPEHVSVLPGTVPWVTAREIIDWDLPGTSIYARKKPLSPNTMKRIYAGLAKFCNLVFVEPPKPVRSGWVHVSLEADVRLGRASQFRRYVSPTVSSFAIKPKAARATGAGDPTLAPFVLPSEGFFRGNTARSVDQPLQTVTSRGAGAFVEPFLYTTGGPAGRMGPHSVDAPLHTLIGRNHTGVMRPYVVVLRRSSSKASDGQARPYSADEPLPTLCAGGNHVALAVPSFFAKLYGGHTAASVDQPLGTLTASYEHYALVRPCIIRYNGNPDTDPRAQSVDEPLTTLDTSRRHGLAQFLISFHGNDEAASLDLPLGTLRTRDRYALVMPEFIPQLADGVEIVGEFDILFRMLTPEEMAKASGAGEMVFTGGREAQVKQIGNMWTLGLSEALCAAILGKEVQA